MLGSQHSFHLSFLKNDTLIKLIYINLAVFIGIKLMHLPFWLMDSGGFPEYYVRKWLAVPSSLSNLIVKPWTLITYMFLHYELRHVFFNMLILFFLGQLFVRYMGEKKLWTLYVAGGIVGAVLYIIFYNVFPVFKLVNPIATNLGASAAVMAIIASIGTYAPNSIIRLFFTIEVKLKYIAIALFVIDVISISNSNSGGHIAHIGGALFGFWFAKQWLKGKDITAWVGNTVNFIVAVFKPKKKMKVEHRKSTDEYDYVSRKQEEQAAVDAILDKISRSGYDSLSKKEKEFLFKFNNK